ncbi:DUF3653 domain-containing protein [Stenotrophomonas sp.]|uniref:DUF3653 domain-containing protein n=1 Tax=Stenotrophomonas sp. TaxID=69392 RepID=UPI0028A9287B|nr:DUF3653 domain-containing protein [Stenotrophomonas sp.]
MRDRNLTGPWAGFAFKGGRLVTPEGRELRPEDLAWLSLLAARAQEWQRMMDAAREGHKRPMAPAQVVDLAEAIQRRAKRSAGAMAGPGAEPVPAGQLQTGPRPPERA